MLTSSSVRAAPIGLYDVLGSSATTASLPATNDFALRFMATPAAVQRALQGDSPAHNHLLTNQARQQELAWLLLPGRMACSAGKGPGQLNHVTALRFNSQCFVKRWSLSWSDSPMWAPSLHMEARGEALGLPEVAGAALPAVCALVSSPPSLHLMKPGSPRM